MPRIAWCTDIHINFLDAPKRQSFYTSIRAERPEAVLVTGDIAEGHNVDRLLQEMTSSVGVPILFVLGNHDFYGVKIKTVRDWFGTLNQKSDRLKYLPLLGDVVHITDDACLTGVDGWADAQLGDYFYSRVQLADDEYIEDLKHRSRSDLFDKRAALGKEEATKAEYLIRLGFKTYQHIYFATHIPPFKEATWHAGAHSDNEWLPFFSCKQVGDVLYKLASEFPEKKITVLCGHTHGSGEFKALPNLITYTGSARYGYPRIERMLEI